MKPCEEFKSTKGHLSITRKGRPYKFCAECCLILQAEVRYRNLHYSGHHKGKEPAWLEFGSKPQTNIYRNFEQFLQNPQCTLELVDNSKQRQYGRPRKVKQSVNSEVEVKLQQNSKDKSKKNDKKSKKKYGNGLLKRKKKVLLSEEKKYGIHSKFQKTGAENGESRKFGICQELNQDNKRGEIEELSSMQDNKEQDGGSINQKKVKKVKSKTQKKSGLKKHQFAEDLQSIHQDEEEVSSKHLDQGHLRQEALGISQDSSFLEYGMPIDRREKHRLYCQNRNWKARNEVLQWKNSFLLKENQKFKKQQLELLRDLTKERRQRETAEAKCAKIQGALNVVNNLKHEIEQVANASKVENSQLQEALEASRARESKDEAITWYKQSKIQVENLKNKELKELQDRFNALEKDWQQQGQDVKKLREMNEDILDQHKKRKENIEEKDLRVESLEEEKNKLISELCIEKDSVVKFKSEFEELVKVLQNHNYGGCQCQLKMVPQVQKAVEHVRDIKLGKQNVGEVERMRKKKKEYKDQLKDKESHIRDLEKRLEDLEKGETKQVKEVRDKLFDTRMELGAAQQEINLQEMQDARYLTLVQMAKDYRDEDIDHFKDIIKGLTNKINTNTTQVIKVSDKEVQTMVQTQEIKSDITVSQAIPLTNTQDMTIQQKRYPKRTVKTDLDPVSPDNVKCYEYFQQLGSKKGKEAFQAMVGSKKFDQIMKNRLLGVLKTRMKYLGGKVGTVLELMAGQGRNYPILRLYFSKVEMLEQVQVLTESMDKRVKKHVMPVQNYIWPKEEYECVVGVWCLSYLNWQDIQDLMEKAIQAVRKGGHIVLFEPVLSREEKQEPRFHNIPDQQLRVRPAKFYNLLFQQFGFQNPKKQRFFKTDCNNEEMVAWLLTNNK